MQIYICFGAFCGKGYQHALPSLVEAFLFLLFFSDPIRVKKSSCYSCAVLIKGYYAILRSCRRRRRYGHGRRRSSILGTKATDQKTERKMKNETAVSDRKKSSFIYIYVIPHGTDACFPNPKLSGGRVGLFGEPL